MAFNFEKAIKEAEASISNPALGAIVLGPSGSGKSSLMGTMPGKILYIYASGENHGPKSAKTKSGDNLIPVCIDVIDGKKITADLAYNNLLEILSSAEQLKKMKVESVAIDGASEIEALIRGSEQWRRACLSASGKHNTFGEPDATKTMFRPIINALNALQASGINYALTCILDVKELGSNGEIMEAMPRILGYSVAEDVVRQFGDVLVVGRMERNGEVKHKIQFMTDVTKASKDANGVVKKAINFAPRIAGITVDKIPALMEADLKDVIKLKKENMK